MMLGIVNSSYGKATNSLGPVLSYFFTFPVASVANGCTSNSFLSKILTSEEPPSLFLLAFAFFFVWPVVRFALMNGIRKFSPFLYFRHFLK